MQKIDLFDNKFDIGYAQNIFEVSRRFPEKTVDIFDSISKNQFISKKELLTSVLTSGIIHKEMKVIVIGSWYGSILVPVLAPLVKEMFCFDIDKEANHIASIINEYDNVQFRSADLTKEKHPVFGEEVDLLIINTSSEHIEMKMHELIKFQSHWTKKRRDIYFAVQSNNMTDIEGHINCVHSLEEFKSHLPARNQIIIEKEIPEERGVRYFLFGQIELQVEKKKDGTTRYTFGEDSK
jgi:hypothetical protein